MSQNYTITTKEESEKSKLTLKDLQVGQIGTVVEFGSFIKGTWFLASHLPDGEKVFVDLTYGKIYRSASAGSYMNHEIRLLRPNEEIVIKGNPSSESTRN